MTFGLSIKFGLINYNFDRCEEQEKIKNYNIINHFKYINKLHEINIGKVKKSI